MYVGSRIEDDESGEAPSWGRGLLQSDDDEFVVTHLENVLGFPLCLPFWLKGPSWHSPAFERERTARELNTDYRLTYTFDEILSGRSVVPLNGLPKERVAIVFGMLAMQTGAILDNIHLDTLRDLRRKLPTLEQQLQVVAALDGYPNDGTVHWVSGSKTLEEVYAPVSPHFCDIGDEFWHSGLG
jgi:hypothetical protein